MLKLPRQASIDYLFKRKINNLATVSRNRPSTEEILNGKLQFFVQHNICQNKTALSKFSIFVWQIRSKNLEKYFEKNKTI